jgi:hypothetical protein
MIPSAENLSRLAPRGRVAQGFGAAAGTSDQSGQTRRIIGVATSTISTSSGSPMRQ